MLQVVVEEGPAASWITNVKRKCACLPLELNIIPTLWHQGREGNSPDNEYNSQPSETVSGLNMQPLLKFGTQVTVISTILRDWLQVVCVCVCMYLFITFTILNLFKHYRSSK
jgi:hypothetical protein